MKIIALELRVTKLLALESMITRIKALLFTAHYGSE